MPSPPRLSRREQKLLRHTGNAVRMYVACISFLAPVLCLVFAGDKYARLASASATPEIPPAATYGTITGIYLPVFAAVAAYVWATRAFPERQAAPHGFGMALFRDAFTLVVLTALLMLPPLLYLLPGKIQTVNTFLVWYQALVTACAGGAFTYYFHATLSPTPARSRARAADGDQPAPTPAARGRATA